VASINSVVLVGNLTRDPESIADGRGCTLGLAVNERIKRGENWEDYASFFDVVVWGNQASAIVQYLRKGQRVGVQGSLRQERWQDKGDGSNRSAVKVYAFTVMFPPKDGGGSGGSSHSAPPASDIPADTDYAAPVAGGDDDIPF
jgi:single-strand DNA-binding protein